MKAVIQRVSFAGVTINGKEKRTIEKGILILLGVKDTDTNEDCDKLAAKCADLRIFCDDDGNMNLSATGLNYDAMVISNFTLCADTKKGKRPSFSSAAKQPKSVDLYMRFVQQIREKPLKNVQTGEFGAHMDVELLNDGPVTLILDTDEWKAQKK